MAGIASARHIRFQPGDICLRHLTYSDSNYAYKEADGTLHQTTYSYYEICDPSCSGGSSGSLVTTDGSGFTISSGGNSVVDRAGTTITTAYGSLGSAGSIEDSNGNYISANISGSNYVLTDTLGQTVLTMPTSGSLYQVVTPVGTVAIAWAQYEVKTDFGCAGVAEYGPTLVSLPYEITMPNGTSYSISYETIPGNPSDVTGRISTIGVSNGWYAAYTYTGANDGTDCSDGSTIGFTRRTPDGTWTYARTPSTGITTITDPQGNQTVMTFQGIYPTEAAAYQGSTSGTLLETSYICYNGAAVPCNSTIALPITERAVYALWSGGLESEVNTEYDAYGLATETDEYDYGSNSAGPLLRKTTTTYASLSNGIVNRPSQISVYNGSGVLVSQTSYQYDQGSVTGTGASQHASISGSRGNPTTVSYLTAGSSTLSRTSSYYDTGTPQTTADFNGAQTSYIDGACTDSLPTMISEPLSLSRSMAWSCGSAVMTSLTDENNETTNYGYTGGTFSEVLSSITDPLGNVTNITNTGLTSVESSQLFNSNSSTTDNLMSYDALGRPYLSQVKEGPSSTTYDSVETDYDSLGRPNRATLPYTAASGAPCSGSCPATTTTYDALGRPLTVTDGGGRTATYSYSGNDVYVSLGPAPSGENQKRKQVEYDGLGRVTSVCEVTAGTTAWPGGNCAQKSSQTGYWTKYAYDALNDLLTVTQNAQSSSSQTRTYSYDGLGRMISETNPESGTTIYTYDADTTCGTSKGDLVKKADAVSDTICFAYDALHRMTSTTYSGTYASVTPSRYFVYDSATVNSVVMSNAKTRLAEAYTCTSCPGTKITDEGFSYTARGEVGDIYQLTPDSGSYYHVDETYWANGTVNQLSGLSGLPTITYGVDGEGRIASGTASSGQNPLSSTTYSAASLPEVVTFGSSDSDSFTYDPNTDRMTQYMFTVNGSSLTGNLAWNPNGSLGSQSITDPFNSSDTQSCSYTHDDLTRVLGATCGSVWSQSLTYDPFGNINKSGTSSFQASYSNTTNRMILIGGSTPSYDADGNVTNDFLNTYSWDANGKPVKVDGVGITYDALGRMVEQNESGIYTEIVYAPAGNKLAFMSGSSLSKAYVPLPAGDVAVYGSSGLSNYHHMDWLGNFRLASTPTRTMPFDTAYGPFGEPYAESGSYTLAFTGQTQDTASNVYDFPAREYGIQGRWPSPDPAGLSAVGPTDPQTWNRYAYVRNRPLTLTDPTGLDDDGDLCVDIPEACSFVLDNSWVQVVQVNDGMFLDDAQLADQAPADFSFLGTTYYMDGVEVPANVALGALSADSASPCPNGTCNGFGTNGQGQVAWVQFYSFAGGVSGYFNPSDLTAGIAAGIYPAPTLGGSQTQGAATNMEWSKPSSTSLSPLFPAPFPIVTASKPFQTAVRDCVNELKQLAKQLAESDSPSQVFQACMQTSGFWPE